MFLCPPLLIQSECSRTGTSDESETVKMHLNVIGNLLEVYTLIFFFPIMIAVSYLFTFYLNV